MHLPSPQPLEAAIEKAWPASDWCESHVVLAVSGGPDSVTLLRIALALKERTGGQGKLFVAHLNHAMRGAKGVADAAWLDLLCRRFNVPLEVGETDVAAIAAEQGDGLEAAARHARYDFLRRTAERLGARFVAVAHTADDQVETVLHRILRGTGLAGLGGIPPARSLSPSLTLVRPLLGVYRREVIDYLAAIGQDFRTDASNADPRWTRNRLRHRLLPILRDDYNAAVDAALLRLSVLARESQQLVNDMAAQIARGCVELEYLEFSRADGVRLAKIARIDCGPLSDQSPLVRGEVCKLAWEAANWPRQAMGFDQWQQLADLARGRGRLPAINLPGNVRARRDRQHLVLELLGLT